MAIMLRVKSTSDLISRMKLLNHISKRAVMKCSPAMVSFVATHILTGFAVSLRLSPQFFQLLISTHPSQNSTIFIDAFHSIMFNMFSQSFPIMTLVLHDLAENILLVFEASDRYLEARNSGLILLPEKETEGGEIDYRYFFSIDMEAFKDIVTNLHAYYDTITVIMTDSQVKFSVGVCEEIVLTKEANQCIIGRMGVEAEVEIQFLFVLNPSDFFIDLALESEPKRIWFFKSLDSCTLMAVPFGLYAQIWVYFPLPQLTS